MAFRPYLFFGGNCRAAFTRYQEIFGGELTLMAMKDAPGEAPPADLADLIIHASLTFGDDLLMASDDPMSDGFGPVQGMMVSYDAPDVDEAKRVFDALAEGGNVTQDLIPTFFSDAFAMCTDRFGTPWMVVGPPKDQPA
jgi:PhnB protein